MALNWDASRVRGYDTLTDEEKVVREALIWHTMTVGFRQITEENWQDFYLRVSLWETAMGASLIQQGGKARPITPEDVRRFVGLSTNAGGLSTAQFLKRLYESHTRAERYHLRTYEAVS